LLGKVNGFYNELLVAMEVIGFYGKSIIAIEATGCYIKSMIALGVIDYLGNYWLLFEIQ
jgi:uncharacterized sodium:solute symporter family permease YidK